MESANKLMGKHILIIDDDQELADTVKIRLEQNRYAVSTLAEGSKAVEEVRRVKPDLILLDIMLPGVDGFSLIRELKRDPELTSIPVLIFSGRPKAAMMELFGPEGIAGYIAKPYDPKDLLHQVKLSIGI